MSEIVEHAESILGWHERHGRSLSRLLRPGLGAEEIERVEAMLGFPLPDDLRDLHVWRDGTDVEKATTLGRAYFFFGEYLLSIEEALEHREIGIEVAEWNRRWVPVFADGGGGLRGRRRGSRGWGRGDADAAADERADPAGGGATGGDAGAVHTDARRRGGG